MELLQSVWDFLASPSGAALGFGLWVVSEALASIPAIQANSVFQMIRGLLSRFKKDEAVKVVMVIGLAFGLAGCGKSLDQIKQAAHALIDIGGKIYEDVKDDVDQVRDALRGDPTHPRPADRLLPDKP